MGSKRTKKETQAEKTGYRWMMRCLTALDAGPGELRRMRGVVATDGHIRVVVHRADARGYAGGWKAFKKAACAAAIEAVELLQAGSFAAGYALVKPGDVEQIAATPYPKSFKVVITLRRL